MSTIFVAGTRTFFQQTAAPTGWTKDTSSSYDDAALRVVSGAASFGGSTGFVSVFTSQGFNSPFSVNNVGSYTLTTPDLPLHTHFSPPSPTAPRPAKPSNAIPGTLATPTPTINKLTAPQTMAISNTGGSSGTGDGGHDHSVTFTASGTMANMAVKYVDVIVASKD